jgi:acyl-CoA thioester hydrolase
VESAGSLGEPHPVGAELAPPRGPTKVGPYVILRPTDVAASDAMSDLFRYYLRVRYIECDAQKVVFNSRYGEYVDVSINEFLRAIGVLPAFLEGRLDFQLVKQTIEWKAPARFDQVLELSIRATRLGTTSFTIGTTFRIAGDEKPITTVETVYVLVDGTTLTKVALTDSLRAALQRGAAGETTDHAAFL